MASGSWTARHAEEIDHRVTSLSDTAADRLDLSAVDELDVFGAWLVQRLVRAAQARGRSLAVTGAPEHFRDLLDRTGQTNLHPPVERRKPSLVVRLSDVLTRTASDGLALVATLGALASIAARLIARPRQLRITSVVHHVDRVGWQAIPIVLMITFLIGCIIAQQGIFHFRQFGADDYVVDLVGILILREIGVLLVAIMVAGRSGSSYTAEIGAMKMREEIDALRTMGRDPVEVLMLPRVVALVLALPVLTFLGAMAALVGGCLVAWIYGGMSPVIFAGRLQEAVSITHFKVGMIKAPFMALVIGVIACKEGFDVRGSAESLGLRTTASVVKSIFFVIVLDGIFAIFFASIGM